MRRAGCTRPASDAARTILDRQWLRWRPLLEFISAQPHGSYWLAEDGTDLIGYARVARFGAIDELTELWVDPVYAGRGAGRGLLQRCWPEPPTPELGRLVLTVGTPANLTLYTDFGVMPVSGHWHLRHRAEDYLERRAQQTDANEPAVHALEAERAVKEWQRLEPLALGYERAVAARLLRPHAHLPGHDGRRARRGDRALLGQLRGRDRAGGGGDARGSGAGRARGAGPGREVPGARAARRLLHDRLMVAARPPAPASASTSTGRAG